MVKAKKVISIVLSVLALGNYSDFRTVCIYDASQQRIRTAWQSSRRVYAAGCQDGFHGADLQCRGYDYHPPV